MNARRNYAPAAFEAGKASHCVGNEQQALTYYGIAAKDRAWKKSAEYEIDLIVNKDKYQSN
jgi:hypothetical protein